MIDPSRSTVVAWYGGPPAALGALVARVQAAAATALGAAFTARDPGQCHATVIGLERAAAPFDPGPLAAHLAAALPLTVQFGGFADERRMTSRGRSLHERGFGVGAGKAVLMGWPVAGGAPRTDLATLRDGCAALGVTHRHGTDPDAYLVVGDVPGDVPAHVLEAAVRRDLDRTPVRVPLTAADLTLVTYRDPALPRATSTARPLLTR